MTRRRADRYSGGRNLKPGGGELPETSINIAACLPALWTALFGSHQISIAVTGDLFNSLILRSADSWSGNVPAESGGSCTPPLALCRPLRTIDVVRVSHWGGFYHQTWSLLLRLFPFQNLDFANGGKAMPTNPP